MEIATALASSFLLSHWCSGSHLRSNVAYSKFSENSQESVAPHSSSHFFLNKVDVLIPQRSPFWFYLKAKDFQEEQRGAQLLSLDISRDSECSICSWHRPVAKCPLRFPISERFSKAVLHGSIGSIWTISGAGLNGSIRNPNGLICSFWKTQTNPRPMVSRGAGLFQVLFIGSLQ